MDAVLRFTVPISDRAPWPTVLVLAHDAEWRAAVARGLEREGFQVLTARHTGHALLVCRRFAKPVDLLIADAISDEGSGEAVAQRLAKEKPGMKQLLFTTRPRTRRALLRAVHHALAWRER